MLVTLFCRYFPRSGIEWMTSWSRIVYVSSLAKWFGSEGGWSVIRLSVLWFTVYDLIKDRTFKLLAIQTREWMALMTKISREGGSWRARCGGLDDCARIRWMCAKDQMIFFKRAVDYCQYSPYTFQGATLRTLMLPGCNKSIRYAKICCCRATCHQHRDVNKALFTAWIHCHSQNSRTLHRLQLSVLLGIQSVRR